LGNGLKLWIPVIAVAILSIAVVSTVGIQESFEYGSGGKPDPRVCGDRLCSEIPGGREAWQAEDETLEENMDKPEIAIISSPLKQMDKGVAPEDVVCKSGLALMIRPSGDAACVKEDSVKKLENKDWKLEKNS